MILEGTSVVIANVPANGAFAPAGVNEGPERIVKAPEVEGKVKSAEVTENSNRPRTKKEPDGAFIYTREDSIFFKHCQWGLGPVSEYNLFFM
jgi:hypothetical protein